MRWASRFPGGRAAVFLLPALLFVLAFLFLTANQLTQVDNAVILAVTVASLWTWRRLMLIFFREEHEAASVWLSLGLFVILTATITNAAWSFYIRAYAIPFDSEINTRFVSVVRFLWAFGFGCLYLVPMARDSAIPPRGWLSLFLIVGFAAGATLLGFWLF